MPTHDEWDRLVNSKWPQDMAKPTAQEAISGAKRLYRRAMGRPFRGKVALTSGNRDTWIRYGTLYVNPSQGWNEIVHLLSHYCQRRKHPGKRPHHYTQLEMEADLTRYVLKNGFHEGRLKREVKVKPKPDRKANGLESAKAALSRWEAKHRRAETAIKKYRKKVRYYEKALLGKPT